MSDDVTSNTIDTDIPARLDRLPWAKFHWLVVIGLGTVWILDGLEVTLVGSISSRLTEHGSGIHITTGQIGIAAAAYVGGACLGALFFGQLTDRFGRKKLFMITLGLYIIATVATAFAFSPLYFYIARFFTGAGIGGEYSAINSAIDELIPARVRGRVDLMINGSYWIGSAVGSAAALFFLTTAIFAKDFGWRLAFGVGAVLGLTILLVRRNVPESPRWLFIHGREEEAEQIVDRIEEHTTEETGQELPEPDGKITVRQRERIPFRQIARTAFKLYPRRSILGLALFVGQAFLYNGVVFNLGGLFTKYFNVSSSYVPVFVILYALGNFLGPLLLGRLFDTVGRKPMIVFTYLGSSVIAAIMAVLFMGGSLTEWSLEAFIMATFFLASAGASAAYLTVSEVFPMETRALAIAFFYAVGTAVGGITGPLVFSHLISSGDRTQVAIAFFIGVGLMALGGVAEIFFGVRAEQQQLEDIAKPLTVEEAEEGEEGEQDMDTSTEHREALRCRRAAFEERARAAEHRAAVEELTARGPGGDREVAERVEVERALTDIAELRARAMDERAVADDQLETAERAESDREAEAARERAAAAQQRAEGFERRVSSISAERDQDAERSAALADAANERARAHEQHAMAAAARAGQDADGAIGSLADTRARLHESQAAVEEERALVHQLRSANDRQAAEHHESLVRTREQLARAAEHRVQAAEQRTAAEELRGEEESAAAAREGREEAERARKRRAYEARVRERIERSRRRRHGGLGRFRPGPGTGSSFYSPGMIGTSISSRGNAAELDLEREVDAIAHALDEHGALQRNELARLVGARYWGPGRFRQALHAAIDENRARQTSRRTLAPAAPAGGHDD